MDGATKFVKGDAIAGIIIIAIDIVGRNYYRGINEWNAYR